MVQSRDDILNKLIAHKDTLFRRYGLTSLGLFGSFSRGDHKPSSDVDLLFETDMPLGMEVVDLSDELEQMLGRRVELVSRKAVQPRMLPYIEKDLVYV